MSSETARILIVDDEAIVRRVLGDGLSQTGYTVQTAATADEALAVIARQQIDLLLLDLQLGDRNGIDVLREVRAQRPQLPILILTAHGSLASAIDAVRLDADDYLLKPISLDALRARVGEVLTRYKAEVGRQERLRTMYRQMQALIADEGLTPAAPEQPAAQEGVYASGPLSLDVPRHQVRIYGQQIELTPSEFAILHTLVRRPGIPVPCVQLIQSFQNISIEEDEARQVMRPHIVRLRRKIEPDPQHPIYILSVRGVGYRWSAEGSGDDEE